MIIDPAAENQVYCTNGTIAKWFINETMIGFNGEQLSNGTSFNKEALPNGKKITWDTNLEHIINNTNNYSYQIIFIKQTAILAFRTNHRNIDYSVSSYFENDVIGVNSSSYCSQYGYSRNYGFPRSNNGSSPWNLDGSVSAYCLDNHENLNIFIINLTKHYQLKIIDDNVTYNYSLIDINSVEEIDITGNQSKFIFNATNSLYLTPESFELIADSNSKVSLVCGLDCPPNTCLKVRCDNIVCCYNNQGKVIDSFYDFNKEVETCY